MANWLQGIRRRSDAVVLSIVRLAARRDTADNGRSAWGGDDRAGMPCFFMHLETSPFSFIPRLMRRALAAASSRKPRCQHRLFTHGGC